MGFPHPTADVPGVWPHLETEVAAVHLPNDLSRELGRALIGQATKSVGHICATTWIFSADAQYTILVRHKTLQWSTPGGHIEIGETSRQGGLRELEEETGLTQYDVRPVVDGPAFIHVTDLAGSTPHRHWNIGWLYIADMQAPLTSTEGARWYHCDDLPQGPMDLKNSVALLRPLVLQEASGTN
jgi:8-oxo-dGTP pyrophosphatase MutT (NUDIX family)